MAIIYKNGTGGIKRQPQDYGYIWPTISNDSELPTSSMGAEDGDRITVTNILSTEGPAIFSYNGSTSTWELVSARVSNFSNLATLQSTYTIVSGAIIAVGAVDDQSAVRYYYNGSVFIQIGKGIIWQLADLNTVDPAVAVGDYGILNNRTYVYHNFIAASTPDSISRSIWIPPDISSASPVLRAYLLGTEDSAARTAQGWTTVQTHGTVTGDSGGSGYTEFTTSSGNGIASIDTLINLVASGTRIYSRAEMRATPAHDAATGFEVGDGTLALYAEQYGTVGVQFAFTDGLNNLQNVTGILGGGGSAGGTYLPSLISSPSLIEVIDNGRSSTTLAGARIFRDGNVYHAHKRSNSTSSMGLPTSNRVRFVSRRTTSGNGILQIRNAYVITVT
jgi:hypothetical protein